MNNIFVTLCNKSFILRTQFPLLSPLAVQYLLKKVIVQKYVISAYKIFYSFVHARRFSFMAYYCFISNYVTHYVINSIVWYTDHFITCFISEALWLSKESDVFQIR